MKNLLIVLFVSLLSFGASAQNVFINEIYYKVADQTERGIEIVGPKKTKLNNYKVRLYDQNGNLYHTETLNGTINPTGSNYNAIWFPIAELHNSDNQSIMLEDNNGNATQEISFGQNTSSPKNSKSFINIGIVQIDSTKSLQLIGTGLGLLDFGWTNTQVLSKGGINLNQFFILPIIVNTIIKNGGVSVNWTTPKVFQDGQFVVEKSGDGVTYEEIGMLFSEEAVSYNFEDKNVEKGDFTYRVKWIDIDYKVELTSNNSDVAISEVVTIGMYPNPVSVGGQLTFQTVTNQPLQVQFYDTMGRLVKQEQMIGTTSLSVNELKTGTYYYRILTKNEAIQEGKIMIVQ